MSEPQAEPAAAHPAPVPPPPPAPERAARTNAAPRYSTFDPRHKSPLLAAFLSAMPGLGQVYVGYYQRGFVHILVVASLIALLVAEVLDELMPLAGLFLAFFWLYNMVDAGRRAASYNQALAEGEEFKPVELPADGGRPGLQGSLVGGTVLVAVGFALLLHTRFDVSFAWLEDWWPVAPIVLGGYLIYLAIAERRGLAEAAAE